MSRRPLKSSKGRRASRGRKKTVSKKPKQSVRRKRRGGFKANSLSRKTCTEVFEKKPGFSRGHYSACKWLRPDLYKETKKGVFDWTRTRRPKSTKPKQESKSEAVAAISVSEPLPTAPATQSYTTVTESIVPSPHDDSVIESTTVTQSEPTATFMTSSDTMGDDALSESSVNSRPVTETLRDLNLNDEWASPNPGKSGGRRYSKRQKRQSRRRNSKKLHAIFRA